MNCDAFIKSNDTYDVIIPREALERYPLDPVCVQRISSNLDIHYYERGSVPPLSIQAYTYTAIPKCFGLLDTAALEASGILQLQNQPALSLFGQGILVGFIDTGIAYTNACFQDGAGTTRIRVIWDQTATPDVLENEDEPDSDGGQERNDTGQSLTGKRKLPPQGFAYGVEYTKEDIDAALASDNPYAIVPQRDENGHGTLLASIACGSEDPAANFIGVAPRCDIAMVKVKEAKPYLREFYYIPQNIPAYQENDIMAAVSYLEQKARQLGESLIICLGMGTNNGSHSGGSELEVHLNEIGALYRRCVVIASGNEANARHHFHGMSNVTLGPHGNTAAMHCHPIRLRWRSMWKTTCRDSIWNCGRRLRRCLLCRLRRLRDGGCHRLLPESVRIRNMNLCWKERVWRSITGQLEEREAISLCLFALTGRQGESGHCRCIRIRRLPAISISGFQ